MANNIAISITADVADLQVKRAIMQTELAQAQKALRDYAKEAQQSGETDELRSSMLAAADAVARLTNQVSDNARRQKDLRAEFASQAAAARAHTAAMEAENQAAQRLPVNYQAIINASTGVNVATRSAAESASVFEQALGVQSQRAQEVRARMQQLEEQQRGSVAMTGQQRQAMIVVGEQFRQVGTEVALGIPAMQIFAQQSGQTIQALSMAANEGSKMAAFLGSGLGIAAVTAVAAIAPLIASMIELGSAEDKALEKLKDDARNTEAARQAKEAFKTTEEGVTAAIYDQQAALQKQADSLKTEAERSYEAAQANLAHEVQIRRTTQALLEQARAQYESSQQISFGAAGGAGAGMAQSIYAGRVVELEQRKKEADAALEAAQKNEVNARSFLDVEQGKAAGDPVAAIRKKYEGSGGLIDAARHRAIAEGKTGDELQRQVQALTEQERKETDAARKAEHPAKARKGPSVTSDWTQELREQEIATGDFFGDQTERELAFWQSKVGLTRKGTREWLDVQGHIFDASRTLARQAYQDYLADLNLQIEADRNSWSKTQADWQEKLAFIRSKFGEQSAEYRNAAREWTRAQTQHDDQEIQQAQLHAQRMVDSLRRDLDAQAKLRDDDARAQETMLRANAGNSPTGDITAAARVAQLHQQLAQQQLADTETLYSAQSAALDAAITKAVSRYGEEQANYQSLLDAKLQADQQYAAQKAQIESQARLQSIQDILAVRSSYRSYIDGTVNASVSAFDGLISGQKTWGQAAGSVYQSVVRQAEAQFARMATNWIVNHVLMTTAQRTQLALQSAAQATGEAAKTGAVVAGTAARTATTATGAAASATITGTHNAKEIISHAATAAAAAYHAMAGIPVVGPVLGAAAAVATFSAVAAFGALASFDKGTNVLPNDMIAQVHAGERIVPAADNAKLLELTARGAGSTGGAASKDGDIHLHYQPTINGQMSFGDQLSGHEDNIIAILRRARRRGAI